ncbi:MAG: phosphatidate cytidylyltransferase, partial [Pseudomonadota bacterium]
MRKRILSALVLAPAALAAAYLGAPYWDQVIVVLGLLMGWEWARLCGGGTLSPAGVGLIAGVLTVLLVAELWGFKPALLALVLAGPAVAGIAAPQFRGRAAWFAAGMLYVGLSCLALIWIRADVEHGLVILLWVLALVWATDTAAYFTGKAIGGPKLAPRISPNKTWAGLAGG